MLMPFTLIDMAREGLEAVEFCSFDRRRAGDERIKCLIAAPLRGGLGHLAELCLADFAVDFRGFGLQLRRRLGHRDLRRNRRRLQRHVHAHLAVDFDLNVLLREVPAKFPLGRNGNGIRTRQHVENAVSARLTRGAVATDFPGALVG